MARSRQRFAEIKQRLWAQIESGELGPRLPPEPELAERYGVSRMTLRRAIAELVSEGFLSARPGAGTFVTEDRTGGRPSMTIGLVLDPYLKPDDDPYFGSLFGALAMRLAARGYRLIYADHPERLVPVTPAADSSALVQPVDGIVAVAFGDYAVDSLDGIRAPVVVAEGVPAAGRTSLLSDNHGGIRAAVDHLVVRGHREIAHISGGAPTNSGAERIAGWHAAMAAHDLPHPERLLVAGTFSAESGRAAATELCERLDHPPGALVCANDRMALGAIQVLNQRGYRVPEDVSVIGFDDLEAAQLASPPLTTVAVDRVGFADRLCALLLEEVDGDAAAGRQERFPVHLVERATTAAPAPSAVDRG